MEWSRERTEWEDVKDLVLVAKDVGRKVREVVHLLEDRLGLWAVVPC